jgi:hypothetical protein
MASTLPLDKLNIGYDDKTTEEIGTIKFPSVQINNNLNWKTH